MTNDTIYNRFIEIGDRARREGRPHATVQLLLTHGHVVRGNLVANLKWGVTILVPGETFIRYEIANEDIIAIGEIR